MPMEIERRQKGNQIDGGRQRFFDGDTKLGVKISLPMRLIRFKYYVITTKLDSERSGNNQDNIGMNIKLKSGKNFFGLRCQRGCWCKRTKKAGM